MIPDPIPEICRRCMTSQEGLILQATEKVLKELGVHDVTTLKSRFDEVVVAIDVETYQLNPQDGTRTVSESVPELLISPLSGPGPYSRDEVVSVVDSVADQLANLFMRLRYLPRTKPRKTFERSIRQLFRRLDYPFDESPVINGKPDFLMPGKALFKVNPAECIIFTAKRTLRERWRQITTEGKNFRLFLATIDEKVSENQLKEMLKQQVYLVIPKKKIDENAVYRGAKNVISFQEFFRDFLDPTAERWLRKGWVTPPEPSPKT